MNKVPIIRPKLDGADGVDSLLKQLDPIFSDQAKLAGWLAGLTEAETMWYAGFYLHHTRREISGAIEHALPQPQTGGDHESDHEQAWKLGVFLHSRFNVPQMRKG